MKVLVTGAAGFIGYHLCRRLLARGDIVAGLDNLNDYYDVALKQARLDLLRQHPGFSFRLLNVADRAGLRDYFAEITPTTVAHLAAQAGVRYSLENPAAYVDANLLGFANMLEGCRAAKVRHLVYASSSSVYGANTVAPFSVHQNVDHPLSLYAATKKANELMAHAYSHLYSLPTTGLRFFTVYGPWGRPDMAMFSFTRAILRDEPITVFNHGEVSRDFTYIDDIVEGLLRVLDRPAEPDPNWSGASPDPGSSAAPYRLYNIGNNQPVKVARLIAILEECLGRKARQVYQPLPSCDVPDTCADVADLNSAVGFVPATPIEDGVRQFVAWYREYYG
ncbi:MAG: NAD-dependent epimerase [Kiritimatiellia bacterium]|nr:NAD-dependent epimerase [Lentisphaerota bacterium]